jgi:LPXTG-site transpeptidase (sortase) family protein
MGAQRLSLSSSTFAGRVKKFDSYQHDSRRSDLAAHRTTLRKQSEQVVSTHSVVQSTPPTETTLRVAPSSHGKVKQSSTLRPVNSLYVKSKNSVVNNQKHNKPQASQALPQPTNRKVVELAMKAVQTSPAPSKSIIAAQFEQSLSAGMSARKQKRSRAQTVMNVFAVFVFLFASAVSVQTLLTNMQTKDVLGAQAATQSVDSNGVSQGTGRDPSEEKVSEDAIINYQVAPELPRYLRIPSIDVFARVKHTGIDADGAVDAPANIHDVSWYDKSAKPGNEIGSSLLLGHVQGWSGPGVFKNIDKLKAGDRFSVEKGSGETIEYEVVKGEQIPLTQINMAEILSALDPNSHDLKLMTCSGSYNAETESYDSRYVVYAKTVF